LFRARDVGLAAMLVTALGVVVPPNACAQDRRSDLEQLQIERDKQRREQLNRTVSLLGDSQTFEWLEPAEGEAPCFRITRFATSHDAPNPIAPPSGPQEIAGTHVLPRVSFDWLVQDLGAFESACLGRKSLDALRRNLDARLAQAGFVTSNVAIPPQNLSTGVLQLMVQTGPSPP
jgi:hemolysin activation/secretion protein